MRHLAPKLAALLVVAGCAGKNNDASAPGEARSSLARQTSPDVSAADIAAVVSGNNAFAFALHRQLIEAGKNMMTSPYSVSTALAMTYAGARGETATQMASALQFALPQGAQDKLAPAFDAVDLALQKPAACSNNPCAPFTLRLANAAWAQKGFAFESAYLDALAQSFGAGVELVDFMGATEPARLTINQWVADATDQKILNLLAPGTVDSSTRLVLTNAVYFKGAWQSPFKSTATAPSDFHLLGGETASVPTLHGELETRAVAAADCDAVELPYRDSHFSMLVVAPTAGAFESFEQSFGVEKLSALDAAMTSRQVTLSLPKFSFQWKSSLVASLKALGLKDAFDPTQADFSGISTAMQLYFSDVIHQSYVALDEGGTEAAAATAVVMAGSAAPTSPLAVSVDRPFLFAIRDLTTGQIVFLGRVVDPR